MSNYEELVQNIKEIIRLSGLKQCLIAERAGYGKKEFSNMLNGRKTIKAGDIPGIAVSLGVTPNELFGFTGQKSDRAG